MKKYSNRYKSDNKLYQDMEEIDKANEGSEAVTISIDLLKDIIKMYEMDNEIQ